MAEKLTDLKTEKKYEINGVNNMAKYAQQRRSPARKRRTNFSFFLLQSSSPSPSSSSSQGSMLESSSPKEILSSISIATSDDKTNKEKVMPKLSMVKCSNQAGHQSSSRQLFGSSDRSNTSNEQDQSSDKQNSSGSIQSESDFHERRRVKRTRKPKIHFDETPFQISPARKIRRLKIMRHLGLIAPVGSPFALTHV